VAQERVGQPEPSDIAGRYEVVQKLGAGAFGTVYKAKDRLLGRMVAIKTIRLDGLAASGSGLDELLARFKREAQVSAQLKHPNIVTIYDIGDFEGLSYLAMEFIDGPGLEKVIASTGRLPVERAAAIGAQIADGLDYAHAHHVVHRDIKPANVMLEAGDRVKVTDFGIAKAIDSGEHLTITGSLLGTPSYMSPEQARGAAIDGRSDLFSVGCILYEMVTGTKAFRGDSITALIFKIITEEPQPISEIDPTIPEPITRVIARALSKAPETRFQTGHELATALLALTSAAAVPTMRQVEVPTVASPAAAAPATVVRTAVARPTEPTRLATAQPAGAAPQTPAVVARRAAPASGPAPAKRSSLAVVAIVAFLFVGFLLAIGGGAWYFLSHRSAPATTATDLSATPTPFATGAGETTPAATPGGPDLVGASPTPMTSGEASTPRSRIPGPVPTAPERVASLATPESVEPTAIDYSFLDTESDRSADGRELGRDLSGHYGGGSSGFGSQRQFRQRPRGPIPRHPAERTALHVTHNLMRAEDALRERSGHYGSLFDLNAVRPALRATRGQQSFLYRGYRFEVSGSADSYQIMAIATHGDLQSFTADSELDSIRVVGER
jgi:eukaryotic-like serine/threonine-protein kinase